MRPLTDHTPKPLLRVGGRPLIEWHLLNLARAGVREVVVNHAWLGQQIQDFLGDGSRWNLKIQHSAEEQALETAGGIARALPWLGHDPFLVINGDIWTDWQASQTFAMADELKRSPSLLAHLVLVPNPAQHPGGDFTLSGKQVHCDASSVVSPYPDRPTYTFSGIGIYKPALFEDVPSNKPFALAPLLRKAMQANQILGSLYSGQWHDIGTPQRLAALDLTLKRNT